MGHRERRLHWENDRAMTKTSTLAAALWDFDGTLVDSEPLWLDAEFELVAELGGTWSVEHADQLIGNSLLDSGPYILLRHASPVRWCRPPIASCWIRC